MSEEEVFNINGRTVESVQDDGSTWNVELGGGGTCIVPKDARNKYHRMVQRWEAAGNTPTQGEGSAKRRLRGRLRDDPVLRAFALELADITGRTEAEQAQALIDHIEGGR